MYDYRALHSLVLATSVAMAAVLKNSGCAKQKTLIR
eukprot:CAMPEP_0183333028 /NCGR_PEP_ID=MMETSP0164_2-20130417/2036_1 /TAXON_ID=221442 /ORGANISM="Coccolithus pelagicus ssp braarudi, Strain PLY182g" /LENGTH=35 /DNA_ID= /DNA_START= /DNA_END= /DNA_ORIENTATION=